MESNQQNFAQYFLSEKDWTKKLEIMYYLRKKTGIYYDNTVVFKTLLTKLFIDYLHKNTNFHVDENLILSARMLCDCKKVQNSTNVKDIENYASKGADFLATLGFSKEFCKICEGVNRYTPQEVRETESDILELTDQFGAMLLDRPERIGLDVSEAITLLQYRNLKDRENVFLEDFVDFVNQLESIPMISNNVKEL